MPKIEPQLVDNQEKRSHSGCWTNRMENKHKRSENSTKGLSQHEHQVIIRGNLKQQLEIFMSESCLESNDRKPTANMSNAPPCSHAPHIPLPMIHAVSNPDDSEGNIGMGRPSPYISDVANRLSGIVLTPGPSANIEKKKKISPPSSASPMAPRSLAFGCHTPASNSGDRNSAKTPCTPLPDVQLFSLPHAGKRDSLSPLMPRKHVPRRDSFELTPKCAALDPAKQMMHLTNRIESENTRPLQNQRQFNLPVPLFDQQSTVDSNSGILTKSEKMSSPRPALKEVGLNVSLHAQRGGGRKAENEGGLFKKASSSKGLRRLSGGNAMPPRPPSKKKSNRMYKSKSNSGSRKNKANKKKSPSMFFSSSTTFNFDEVDNVDDGEGEKEEFGGDGSAAKRTDRRRRLWQETKLARENSEDVSCCPMKQYQRASIACEKSKPTILKLLGRRRKSCDITAGDSFLTTSTTMGGGGGGGGECWGASNDDDLGPIRKIARTKSMSVSTTTSTTESSPNLMPHLSLPPSYKAPNLKLPIKENSLNRISSETMIRLMKGEFAEHFDRYLVIDCRYTYEYKGGHIPGAKNIHLRQGFDDVYKETRREGGGSMRGDRVAVVFHCEYSKHRGPKACDYFRQLDRLNNEYPKLTFPQLFVLDGGYRNFFRRHCEMCEGNYISMWDDAYQPVLVWRGRGAGDSDVVILIAMPLLSDIFCAWNVRDRRQSIVKAGPSKMAAQRDAAFDLAPGRLERR
eukprot:jgi/Bigna1/66960/fgenesh1_pg.2_\